MQISEARDLVVAMYRSLLDREPDEGGLLHFTRELVSSRLTAPTFAGVVATSDEFRSRQGLVAGLARPAGCTQQEAMAVYEQFGRYTRAGRPGYITNFLGGLTATRYVNLPNLGGHVEGYPIPRNFHAEMLEWVGTLRAVLDAKGSFTMMELGAGWAPWCTVGIIAAGQKGLASDVTAVEGDADHVEFIQTSFQENRHAPRNCHILHGIVGAQDGQARFPRVRDASIAYGSAAQYGEAGNAGGELASEMDILPCYSLGSLLKDHARVDLIHCDVQGAEHDIFAAAMPVVTQKVRRVLIGTHSLALDRSLIKLCSTAGWDCEGIEAATIVESGGHAHLNCDGTQLWRNDRLA